MSTLATGTAPQIKSGNEWYQAEQRGHTEQVTKRLQASLSQGHRGFVAEFITSSFVGIATFSPESAAGDSAPTCPLLVCAIKSADKVGCGCCSMESAIKIPPANILTKQGYFSVLGLHRLPYRQQTKTTQTKRHDNRAADKQKATTLVMPNMLSVMLLASLLASASAGSKSELEQLYKAKAPKCTFFVKASGGSDSATGKTRKKAFASIVSMATLPQCISQRAIYACFS